MPAVPAFRKISALIRSRQYLRATLGQVPHIWPDNGPKHSSILRARTAVVMTPTDCRCVTQYLSAVFHSRLSSVVEQKLIADLLNLVAADLLVESILDAPIPNRARARFLLPIVLIVDLEQLNLVTRKKVGGLMETCGYAGAAHRIWISCGGEQLAWARIAIVRSGVFTFGNPYYEELVTKHQSWFADVELHIVASQALLTRGDALPALEIVQRQHDAHPADTNVLLQYANALIASGRQGEGFRIFERLLGQRPADRGINIGFLNSLVRMGAPLEALQHVDSHSGSLSRVLARHLFLELERHGFHAEALLLANTRKQILERDAVVLAAYGRALSGTREYGAAASVFGELGIRFGWRRSYIEQRIDNLSAAGQHNQALAAFRELRSGEPISMRWVRTRLRLIEATGNIDYAREKLAKYRRHIQRSFYLRQMARYEAMQGKRLIAAFHTLRISWESQSTDSYAASLVRLFMRNGRIFDSYRAAIVGFLISGKQLWLNTLRQEMRSLSVGGLCKDYLRNDRFVRQLPMRIRARIAFAIGEASDANAFLSKRIEKRALSGDDVVQLLANDSGVNSLAIASLAHTKFLRLAALKGRGKIVFERGVGNSMLALVESGVDPLRCMEALDPRLQITYLSESQSLRLRRKRSDGNPRLTSSKLQDRVLHLPHAAEREIFSLSNDLAHRAIRELATDDPSEELNHVALVNALSDMFITRLRNLWTYFDVIDCGEYTACAIAVSSPSYFIPVIDRAISRFGEENVGLNLSMNDVKLRRTLLSHLGLLEAAQRFQSTDLGPRVLPLKVAVEAVEHTWRRSAVKDAIVVVTNPSNPSYQRTALNIVQAALDRSDVEVWIQGANTDQAQSFQEVIRELSIKSRNQAIVRRLPRLLSHCLGIRKPWRTTRRARIEGIVNSWLRQTQAKLLGTNIAPALAVPLSGFFDERLPMIRAAERVMTDYFAANTTRAVIVTPGRGAEPEIAVSAARSVGIPTIDVQALVIAALPRYRPPLADTVAVIDDRQAKIMTEHFGIPHNRVEVVGYPGMSILRGPTTDSFKDAILSGFKVASTRRMIITFANQPDTPASCRRYFEILVEACRCFNNLHLVMKLHPRENIDRESLFEVWSSELDAKTFCTVTRNIDIHELMYATDIMVTRFSNVGLEAAILGRPVVAMNLEGVRPVLDLVDMGVAIEANTVEQLKEVFEDILNRGARCAALKESQERYFARVPQLRMGKTNQRILDIACRHDDEEGSNMTNLLRAS